MRAVAVLSLWVLACLLPAQVRAGAGALETEQEVVQATMNWIEAYNSRDAARIAALYAPDAVFWGTRSSTIATRPEQILEYFTESARNPNLRASIDDRRVRVLEHGGAVVAGTYTVKDLKDGQEVSTPGRFTFVLEKRAGKWVILHHHSSRMP